MDTAIGNVSDLPGDLSIQPKAIRATFSDTFNTATGFFFSRYGYPLSIASSVVSKDAVRKKCAFLVQDLNEPYWSFDENCTVFEVSQHFSKFISDEEYKYFVYYVFIALPLITLAILFNTVAVIAVCKIKQRQPRYAIVISLSVSDVILSTTTLIKRVGNVESLSTEFIRNILVHEVNVVWQSAFLMSAMGLVCLAADNFIAVAAPFSYGTYAQSSWLLAVMPALWTITVTLMIGLRLASLNYSVIVQYVVAAAICTLLFVIFTAYGFTCIQAMLYRRRTNRWAQPEQKSNLRRRIFKGFLTTAILVLICLMCWGPLVCYLLVGEESINAAHPVFQKFLLFCLSMFHLGAVLNPIIYSLRFRGVRQSLFQMFTLSSSSHPSIVAVRSLRTVLVRKDNTSPRLSPGSRCNLSCQQSNRPIQEDDAQRRSLLANPIKESQDTQLNNSATEPNQSRNNSTVIETVSPNGDLSLDPNLHSEVLVRPLSVIVTSDLDENDRFLSEVHVPYSPALERHRDEKTSMALKMRSRQQQRRTKLKKQRWSLPSLNLDEADDYLC